MPPCYQKPSQAQPISSQRKIGDRERALGLGLYMGELAPVYLHAAYLHIEWSQS